MELGPLQLVAVGFDSPSMDGSVLGELAAIRAQGMVRLVDALGVHKDEEGAVWSLEMSDLTDEQALFAGAAIGALIGLGAGGESGAAEGAVAAMLTMAERREAWRIARGHPGHIRPDSDRRSSAAHACRAPLVDPAA